MPRNRRHECTNWRFISSHLSICVLFGDETRVRAIRHIFVAFFWTKLSKWLAQCKRREENYTLFAKLESNQGSSARLSDVLTATPRIISKLSKVSKYATLIQILSLDFRRSVCTCISFVHKRLYFTLRCNPNRCTWMCSSQSTIFRSFRQAAKLLRLGEVSLPPLHSVASVSLAKNMHPPHYCC